MTPFPVGLSSPGKRLSSTRENRDAVRLMAIIAEHHLRGFARYTPRDVTGDGINETWCNLFAQDVCEAMGVMLPRNTRANDLVRWLELDSKQWDWEAVPAHVAQRMADEGQLALVVWHNPAGPGHIAVLVPSLGEPDYFCAQAGRVNFTRGTVSQGFGCRVVSYFAHP